MEYLKIEGGRPLCGQVCVQGSKNAVLPMLSAALLNRGRTVLHHCPRIRDVEVMLEILTALGCCWGWEGSTLWVDASGVDSYYVPEHLADQMRSSITLLGSLLGRTGQAVIPRTGGCVIGERPIDLHIRSLKRMGVEFRGECPQVEACCPRLKGSMIDLDFPSVGATENVILAAVLAEGTTWIRGAAREPEIADLCGLLCAMGAQIYGAGSSCIRIRGVQGLHDTEYTVSSDRIVAGTYLFAAAACGGEVELTHAPISQLTGVFPILRNMGLGLKAEHGRIRARMQGRSRGIPGIETKPYPGFPTDLQSPLLAALCTARGASSLTEHIFEARFKIAEELGRMGARIRICGNTAHVQGVERLFGCDLEARELRGGAALCVAAAGAQGISRIFGCPYIFRGYENVIGDLKNLGVVIHLEKSQ